LNLLRHAGHPSFKTRLHFDLAQEETSALVAAPPVRTGCNFRSPRPPLSLSEKLGHKLAAGLTLRYAVDVHQFVRPMACMVRFTIAGGVR
jgi:hypothetical protein